MTMTPSPLWYATRGTGVAATLLLTLTVVLGIGTAMRWEGSRTPRFITASLHRSVSLMAVVLLTAHVATAIADPFAHISVADALLPFSAAYRPLWLGLGVCSMEILAVVVVTSLLRSHIGARTWRAIHWAAYASWPLAIVHGLGTGSDAQAPWLVGLTAACIAAVLLAGLDRLTTGRTATLPVRALSGVMAVAAVAGIVAWAVVGPLRPGWAVKAGTPAALLPATPAPTPLPSRRGSFSDELVGTVAHGAAGNQIALRDVIDTALTFIVEPPAAGQTLPTLTVARDGHTLCTVPASAQQTLYAVCGSTRLVIALTGDTQHLTGRVTASGPVG